jgi:hypothetical protein
VHRSPLVEFTRTPGKRTGTFLMQAPGMRDTSAQSELAERFWERIAPDSIALTWGSGFSGTRMRLQVRGDTLDGTAIGFTDTWTEGQPAPVPLPVEGFRVPCPTAPRRAGAT